MEIWPNNRESQRKSVIVFSWTAPTQAIETMTTRLILHEKRFETPTWQEPIKQDANQVRKSIQGALLSWQSLGSRVGSTRLTCSLPTMRGLLEDRTTGAVQRTQGFRIVGISTDERICFAFNFDIRRLNNNGVTSQTTGEKRHSMNFRSIVFPFDTKNLVYHCPAAVKNTRPIYPWRGNWKWRNAQRRA